MRDIAGILDAVAGAGWLLPVVFAVVAIDAMLPVLPSGTTVLVAGVLSASGRVHVAAVVLAAATAACFGDNLVFTLGRRGKRVVSGERGGKGRQRAYAWISHGLRTRPASVIIPSRFVPGVRTAVMLYAGAAGYPPRQFRRLSAGAGLVWGATTTLSGYLGGVAFGGQPVLAMATALAMGAAVAAVVEATGRRLRGRTDLENDQVAGLPAGALSTVGGCP